MNHVGKRYFNTINDPVLSDHRYTVENDLLTCLPNDERWEASLWVNNLTDTPYILTAFDLSTARTAAAGRGVVHLSG